MAHFHINCRIRINVLLCHHARASLLPCCLRSGVPAAPLLAQTYLRRPRTLPVKDGFVLHAAHLLDVERARSSRPEKSSSQGDQHHRRRQHRPASGQRRHHRPRRTTLMPGLIDAHVHLFLHPGAEISRPSRNPSPSAPSSPPLPPATISWPDSPPSATWAPKAQAPPIPPSATPSTPASSPARACASAATPSALLGGHEDAIGFNPAEHISPTPPTPTPPTSSSHVIRAALKQGADFIKIYQTGHDTLITANSSRPINSPKPSSPPP